jgi:hypothetical protein
MPAFVRLLEGAVNHQDERETLRDHSPALRQSRETQGLRGIVCAHVIPAKDRQKEETYPGFSLFPSATFLSSASFPLGNLNQRPVAKKPGKCSWQRPIPSKRIDLRANR